jgi:hypothetical protein
MDDGSCQFPGAKLNTAGFTHADCLFLAQLLNDLYGSLDPASSEAFLV